MHHPAPRLHLPLVLVATLALAVVHCRAAADEPSAADTALVEQVRALLEQRDSAAPDAAAVVGALNAKTVEI